MKSKKILGAICYYINLIYIFKTTKLQNVYLFFVCYADKKSDIEIKPYKQGYWVSK